MFISGNVFIKHSVYKHELFTCLLNILFTNTVFINRSVFTCLRVCLRVFACLFTKKNGACLRLRVCLRKKLARVYVCVFVYEKKVRKHANMFACL